MACPLPCDGSPRQCNSCRRPHYRPWRNNNRSLLAASLPPVRPLSRGVDRAWFGRPFFVGGFCFAGVMSSPAESFAPEVNAPKPIDVLLDEVSELIGQRNAIDGQLVQIVAEIDRDGLWGATGCRSVPALVAWMTGDGPPTALAGLASSVRSGGAWSNGSLVQLGGATNRAVQEARRGISNNARHHAREAASRVPQLGRTR